IQNRTYGHWGDYAITSLCQVKRVSISQILQDPYHANVFESDETFLLRRSDGSPCSKYTRIISTSPTSILYVSWPQDLDERCGEVEVLQCSYDAPESPRKIQIVNTSGEPISIHPNAYTVAATNFRIPDVCFRFDEFGYWGVFAHPQFGALGFRCEGGSGKWIQVWHSPVLPALYPSRDGDETSTSCVISDFGVPYIALSDGFLDITTGCHFIDLRANHPNYISEPCCNGLSFTTTMNNGIAQNDGLMYTVQYFANNYINT
ncbi:MAG: hypothetical protein IJ433_03370, partial [Ruminococcus sp.]|nr:hypothetical protein [Ruminococcus sp.]